ncbi:MAG: hypothetical protein NC821_02430 [Candidatus Omnitrophica bacterium]|nr:hypothetical protein [Candidatus Omnitrophota bacterium]
MNDIFIKFSQDIADHREVSRNILDMGKNFVKNARLEIPFERLSVKRYFEKNIFSILFLSIYRAFRIPKKKRIYYGSINYCIRGIVTAADNILDKEDKNILDFSDLPKQSSNFKFILQIIVLEQLLSYLLKNTFLLSEIVDVLIKIGSLEAEEEAGQAKILTPNSLLKKVHSFRGGALLNLAFLVPQALELRLRKRFEEVKEGVHLLGIGLQILDDVVDFEKDLKDKRYNYLISSIEYRDGREEETTQKVVREAITFIKQGFKILRNLGYPLEERDTIELIRTLFYLRGLKNLWKQKYLRSI